MAMDSLPDGDFAPRLLVRSVLVLVCFLIGSCVVAAMVSILLLIGYTQFVGFVNEFPVNMLQLACLFPLLLIGVIIARGLTERVRRWFSMANEQNEDTGGEQRLLVWLFVILFLALVVLVLKEAAPIGNAVTFAVVAFLSAWGGGFLGAMHPALPKRTPHAKLLWIGAMALTWVIGWVSLLMLLQRYPDIM